MPTCFQPGGLLVLCLLLWGTGLLPAAEPPAVAPASPGLVWKVTGGKSPLFLAGSLHFLENGRRQAWPEPLAAAYRQCQTISFELDSEDLASTRTRSTIQAWGRLPAGTNLWNIVTPETRTALDAAVSHRATRNEAADCHPWMAALLISQRQFSQSGIHLADGMETQISRRARKDGKRLTGLGPVLDHYRNLTRLSPEAQDYFLLMSLAPADGMAADLQQLERAWRGGDLAFLAPRSAGAYSGNPELRTALLNGRNQSWMPSLRRLTDSSRPVLVVVGCLHLCGPGSLPALMQARGYTVQPYFGEPASPIAPTAAAPPPAPSSAVRQLRALVSSERAPDVLRGRIPGERSSPP